MSVSKSRMFKEAVLHCKSVVNANPPLRKELKKWERRLNHIDWDGLINYARAWRLWQDVLKSSQGSWPKGNVTSSYIRAGWPIENDSRNLVSAYVYVRTPVVLGYDLPDRGNRFVVEALEKHPTAKVYLGSPALWEGIDWSIVRHGNEPQIPYIRRGQRVAIGFHREDATAEDWDLFVHMADVFGVKVLPQWRPQAVGPLRLHLAAKLPEKFLKDAEALIQTTKTNVTLRINSASTLHVITSRGHTEFNYPAQLGDEFTTWELRAHGQGGLGLMMGARVLIETARFIRPLNLFLSRGGLWCRNLMR